MSAEACCTCASLLSSSLVPFDEKHPGPRPTAQRHLECCGRVICEGCTRKNPRFETYCPFCQLSSAPSILPQSIREPPSYSPPSSPLRSEDADLPPPYSLSTISQHQSSDSKAKDVVHFVNHTSETLPSIALRYRVPVQALRRANHLYADHLLAARRTLVIPGDYYKVGVSLSPRPVEGEEEELRKAKVRRWMVACKAAEYDVALIYLKQNDYNLDRAVEAYKADEAWEKTHPLPSGSRGARPARLERAGFR